MIATFNGVDLGDERFYAIQSIDGLDSLPDLTIGITPKPRRNGSWLGGKLSQKRVVEVVVNVMGDPADNYLTTKPMAALQAACDVSDEERPLNFDFGYGEEPVMVNASVTSFDAPRVAGYQHLRQVTIEFTATDPNKYIGVAQSKKTEPPIPAAPAVYGLAYGFAHSAGTATSGSFTATNAGNASTHVVYRIVGPVNRPSITLTDSQGVRRTQFNVDLKANQRLEVSSAGNSVKRNGADAFGSATGALIPDLHFRPGDTTVAFNGAGDPPAKPGTLTASWRDATR